LEPWFTADTFSFRDEGERSTARGKFLIGSRNPQHRSIGVIQRARWRGAGAFYLLTLRPAQTRALLPIVSHCTRELDVVLLHEGILEPALGITPQAVTSEKNLTYEREASAALDAVDSGAAQIAFL